MRASAGRLFTLRRVGWQSAGQLLKNPALPSPWATNCWNQLGGVAGGIQADAQRGGGVGDNPMSFGAAWP